MIYDHPVIRHVRRGARSLINLIKNEPYRNLLRRPRYVPFSTTLLGKRFDVPDARSFYFSYQEIFKSKIYAFSTHTEQPRIIDCGANIGVSCVFFNSIYPLAQITAIEADPAITKTLTSNLARFNFSNLNVINAAVAGSRGQMTFLCEGADGGRLIEKETADNSAVNRVEVPTILLDDLIDGPVDMLKMDIEGAETDAFLACTKLNQVQRVFVEYHSFADKTQSLPNLLACLNENGFRISIHGQHASSRPFMKTELQLGMDLQLNIFAFRDVPPSEKTY